VLLSECALSPSPEQHDREPPHHPRHMTCSRSQSNSCTVWLL